MRGKFNPTKNVDTMSAIDKAQIGTTCNWTAIGVIPRDNPEYGGQNMMAPDRDAGFSFGWTPEEDIDYD